MPTPYLLYSSPEGEIYEETRLQALAFGGRPLEAVDLIPLPDGVTLSMMPERLAVGKKRSGALQTLLSRQGCAVAALLPIGYTRTLLPGYEKMSTEVEPLPFFGYSAVAGMNGKIYVAALKTDDPHKWHPRSFQRNALEKLVKEKQANYPNNRVIGQHAHCALDYSCPTASNLFFERWEMAIAVSPSCNARCIGCISKQEEEELISPQDRLTFVPSVDEIVEAALPHLEQAEDAIVSFGQGCEGDPLLQWPRIEKAIKALRERTDRDTIRVSTISGHVDTYNAYYRPLGYTFDEVKESLKRGYDAGLFTSINLLCFPGMIDREQEVEALITFVQETNLHLIQLRNLNIDPEVLLPRMPDFNAWGKELGMRRMIAMLKRECPEVEIGNFSRPIRRKITEDAIRE